jgi:NADP-dependent 3-hydroxy acid dehydrogenase YdfG
MTQGQLDGQVVLVTGGGSGIGAATARDLAEAGAAVVVVGRRREPLEEQVRAIVATGGRAAAFQADVRDFDSMRSAVDHAIATFGRFDVLIANAAIADYGPVESADPDLWEDIIRTNVLGVLYAVRAALPHLAAQGSGHVVIVSSASGRTTYVGEPAYITSKHATVAFADSLRKEVARHGIRVTVVEPGLVETPLIHVYPEADELVPGVIPLDPADVAAVIRFALERPPNVDVFEVVVWPTSQAGL